MSDAWQVRVYDQQKPVCTAEPTGPVELGRQNSSEEALYSLQQIPGRQRLVVAHKEEKLISRRHALLEPQRDGTFLLTNLSDKRPIGLPDGKPPLQPNASCTVAADALLMLGQKAIRLQKSRGQALPLRRLAEPTLPPGQISLAALPLSRLARPSATGIEMKALVPWLQATLDVLQSAASSADFFDKAARAVVDLIDLDSGRVLLLKEDEWQTQALCLGPRISPETSRPVSRHVLNTVRQEKRTFWEVAAPSAPIPVSLREIDAVVAAPVLDRHGEVIGAIYGDRHQVIGSSTTEPITEWEAMLVEVLARGIAAGLARLEQEQVALAARVQFEQFFTPELSRQLARQPDLLQGRDAEVTLLFSDIRGFSRISEKLGPARTVELIRDVMGALSDCVRAQAGVLVDYIGDELIAMWGAPEEQADHAQLACRAALAMLDQVPKLNDRWQPILKEPMDLGIGINTGLARVGNIGSHHKFKYGPLGNTVNLASRVQGATKYLKRKLLITGATQGKLGSGFATRRLCQVRVVNIAEPVALYELVSSDQAGWLEAKMQYEEALEQFENKNFSRAARILGTLRVQNPSDAPALLLLYRAVQCLVEEPNPFDPVWALPGK
jgi:adenylate cyclase